jgi:PEP-CTERM motif
MINTLRRGLFTLCALVAISTAPASAATLYFTGTCTDCPDIGEGVLTTTEVGNTTTFNFTYVSDWISYTMTNAGVRVSGVPFSGLGFTLLPGQTLHLFQADIDVTSFGGVGNPLAAGITEMDVLFFLGNNGNWETGNPVPLDFGINGAFGPNPSSSAVPEPSTLGLAGLSAGLLVFRQWRQRRA